jgi:hypothetical protein
LVNFGGKPGLDTHCERLRAQAYRQRTAWGDDLAIDLSGHVSVGPDLHVMSLVVLKVPAAKVSTAEQHATGQQCPAHRTLRSDKAHVQEPVVQSCLREQHEPAGQDPDVSHHDRLRPPNQRLTTVEAHLELMGLAAKAR